tara:strand:- start:1813 stop:2292 length:480 start_codon:yes stop_codon:yes gene_type:complete
MSSLWTKVSGWDNYEISKSGTVRNSRNKHVMSQHLNGSGYNRVQLSQDGISKHVSVHKLLWTSFIGPVPEGKVLDHINNNKLTNRLDNLQLLTCGENIKKGKQIKQTRKSFTDLQKKDIQNDINLGLSIREVAKRHPISWQWVAKIKESGDWVRYGTNV